MLDWLKQRVISWLLSRTVGKWIAIDRRNLHAEAGSDAWTLVAENLSVKTDCLDDFDFPFRVRSGAVEKLTIIWCTDKVIKIHIHRVIVELETRVNHVITPEARQRAQNAAKQQLLEQWEARLDDNLKPQQQEASADNVKEEPAAFRAFLDKLEISISSIDFVYHDAAGTLGAHIDSVTLQTLSPAASDPIEHTVKSASVAGFFVYIDSAHTPCSAPAATAPPAAAALHCYVARPCCASVRLSYDMPAASVDDARPVTNLCEGGGGEGRAHGVGERV